MVCFFVFERVPVFVCGCVCLYVCLFVRKSFLCAPLRVSVCMCLCGHVSVSICLFICLFACVFFVFMCVCA